ADVVEFTIEANPEDVNPDKVALWRDCGINRVSIGVQSLCDDELRAVGRRHDADAAIKAIDTVASGGIANISADVIFGLPGQSLDSLALTLRTLLALPVTHLSAYCLMYEPGTRLYAMRQRGVIADTDDDVIEQMYRLVCDMTADAGFDHYEISNYARPGCASRHNSAYWVGTPYLGLGPAAHSFDGSVRRYNPSSIKQYLAAENPAIVDPETPAQRLNDVIMTRLRTAPGLPLNAIDPAFFNEVLAAAQTHICSGNLILSDDNRLYIPKTQWLIADTIIRDLFVIADD
ncbi:MAG: coproporphyrinogen-III oxidase family protein, partial [Muribaculaceae bacterium]